MVNRQVIDVSIHAPAWGATNMRDRINELQERFNPRARVGRDWLSSSSGGGDESFNPRARVGRDLKMRLAERETAYRFNPRARVGRDKYCILLYMKFCMFQSTRPRGARRSV